MNRIKLLAVALMLALAGFVYAAGNAQEAKKACGMEKAECCASCCKGEDSCCKDGKSCCKADKSGKAHACDMSKDGAACCSSGGGCCGEGCCTKEKAKTN